MTNAKFFLLLVILALIATAIYIAINKDAQSKPVELNPIINHSEILDTK